MDGMEQLPSVWNRVPLPLLPLFLHQCMDRMCGRDGGRKEDLIPSVFPDEESLQTAAGICQQSLMQWIDIRDKNDVSFPAAGGSSFLFYLPYLSSYLVLSNPTSLKCHR